MEEVCSTWQLIVAVITFVCIALAFLARPRTKFQTVMLTLALIGAIILIIAMAVSGDWRHAFDRVSN